MSPLTCASLPRYKIRPIKLGQSDEALSPVEGLQGLCPSTLGKGEEPAHLQIQPRILPRPGSRTPSPLGHGFWSALPKFGYTCRAREILTGRQPFRVETGNLQALRPWSIDYRWRIWLNVGDWMGRVWGESGAKKAAIAGLTHFFRGFKGSWPTIYFGNPPFGGMILITRNTQSYRASHL